MPAEPNPQESFGFPGGEDLLTDSEAAAIIYSTVTGYAECGQDAVEEDVLVRVVDKVREWKVAAGLLDLVQLGMLNVMDVYDDGTFKLKLSMKFLDDNEWLTKVTDDIEAKHAAAEDGES